MKKLCLVLLFVCFNHNVALADDASTDLSALFAEAQKLRIHKNEFRMIWLFPAEIFKATAEARMQAGGQHDTPENRAALDLVLQVLDKYTIFVLVDDKSKAQTPTQIQRVAMRVDDGEWLVPAVELDMPPLVEDVLAGIINQMNAASSKATQVIFFTTQGRDGKKLFLSTDKKNVSLQLDDEVYIWNLPFVSLLPKKRDARTGATFPGNYLYNPFTGDKLE
jgi:hypothetical protein